MSTVRVGTTKQYADNWDSIFGGKRKSAASQPVAKAAAKSARKSPKKSAKGGAKKAAKKSSAVAKRKRK